ncbi:glycine betaine ABC transporter substrate-binding protein [Alicyclobacillus kakegawensis]|uniref:glycine betaine ABC transporter substrate-binding protein n=1 Tax=Alicyclobacillus kakegawensis TaxID=392012 RepID=UPI0008343186|nr:glycine betaine ABC transporter substrate-binding protein [Alicyclobacillus kakegawensis]
MNKNRRAGVTAAVMTAIIIVGIVEVRQNALHNANASAASDQDKTITLGYVNWEEDVAVTYLWANLLRQRGYHVDLQALDLGPMYAGLSKGGVDVFLDAWVPEQQQYLHHYSSTLTEIGRWYEGVTQEGFVVPQYVTDVHSISDLKTHASEFGNQVIGIDAGSVEMHIAQKALDDYGASKLTLVPSSDLAMLATLMKDYEAKKPVVVTLWSPHWIYSEYKLKYLSDPKGDWGKAGRIQGEANKAWASEHPQAMKWFRNFKMSEHQLETLEQDIHAAKTPQAGVEKWMQNNLSTIDTWFT